MEEDSFRKDEWTTLRVRKSTSIALRTVGMEFREREINPTMNNVIKELVGLFWFVRSKPKLWDEYMASKR